MKNYKLVIQYEGTRYKGWQRQDTTEQTIQGKLEQIFSKMENRRVEVTGSGRTDAGVHALGQVANVQLMTDMSQEEIMNYVNQYLPEDIAVISITEVSERFHSRLNAKRKMYLYRVRNAEIRDVFNRRYVYVFPEKLDLQAMRRAAGYLIGTHDFQAFCTKKKMKKSTVRRIDRIEITKEDGEIRFLYEGNGFLYHMARIMTGTLLEVGTGKREPEDIQRIFELGKRENAGELVPGCGLTLVRVEYDEK
ncbi:MAG: tRNA pseudouridine(38-40) synthase TruA [Lachnospiraceae bacterium]|nr:tRNA pseudouridine(38-40) synthase TruA [Lachnospiraceae bacterium]